MIKVKKIISDSLFEAILKLETIEECYNFFEDICTYKEIESMGNRLEVAKLLNQGKTYEEILKETTISSSTLSKVSKALKYGPGGYKMIMEKIEKNSKI